MQRLLSKRVLRELKNNFFRYLALFLLIAFGMYIVVSIVAAAETVIAGVSDSQQRNQVEDGQFGVFVPLNKDEITKIEAKGITLEQEFYLDYTLAKEESIKEGKDTAKAVEVEVDKARTNKSEIRVYRDRNKVNLISLREGTVPLKSGDLVLEQHYADKHGLRLGDTIAIGRKAFKLVGIGSTPDYDAAYKNLSDSSVESSSFGTAFVGNEDYEALKAKGEYSHSEEFQYSYLLNNAMSNGDFKELLRSFELDRDQITDPYFLEMLQEVEQTKDEIEKGTQELAKGTKDLRNGLGELISNNSKIMAGTEGIFRTAIDSLNTKLHDSGVAVTITEEHYFKQLDELVNTEGIKNTPLEHYLAMAKQQLQQLDAYREGVKAYLEGTTGAKKGSVRIASGAASLQEKADDLITEYLQFDYDNLTYFIPRDDNMRIGASVNDVTINKYAGIAAGVIVMALFTYVISVFVIHGIEQESSVIGALYALGVKRRELVSHYLLLPVTVTLFGGVVGTILGFLPCGVNLQMAESVDYFSLPILKTVYPAYLILYGIAMPPVIAAVVNYFVIGRNLKRTALSLLRMEQKSSRVKEFELGKLGFTRSFQLRQQLRELRSVFTVVIGMFISLLILMLGINCFVISRNLQTQSGKDTKYEYMYSYKYPTKQVPEGGKACYIESLKKEIYGYQLEVAVIGIREGNPYFPVKVSHKKNEITISGAVASKFKLKLGDKLVLTDEINYRDYAFTIKEIVPYSVGLYTFLDLDSMRELFGQEHNYYNTVLSDHSLPIEEGRLYSVISRGDIIKSSEVFMNQMRPLIIGMVLISVLIFAVVMYLMMKVMIDRSAFSISLMKIFGYRKKEIKKLYLNGNFVLIALGALVCIPLSKLCMDTIYPYLISNVACGVDLTFSWSIYVVIYLGILLCYLIINQLLVARLEKMVPAMVLKNRE